MTKPTDPDHGEAGGVTGSAAVDDPVRGGSIFEATETASPWGRDAVPADSNAPTATETTMSLPPLVPAPPVPSRPSVAARAAQAAQAAPQKVRSVMAIRRPKTASSPRRAKLQLRRMNVWSVLRFSCVLAIALFFVWLIMVGVLYAVLDVTHVFSKVNDTVRTIDGSGNTKDVITPSLVFGGAFVIGLVNIVLFIALSTVGSVVYNLCADLVGGIEVTFSEHE